MFRYQSFANFTIPRTNIQHLPNSGLEQGGIGWDYIYIYPIFIQYLSHCIISYVPIVSQKKPAFHHIMRYSPKKHPFLDASTLNAHDVHRKRVGIATRNGSRRSKLFVVTHGKTADFWQMFSMEIKNLGDQQRISTSENMRKPPWKVQYFLSHVDMDQIDQILDQHKDEEGYTTQPRELCPSTTLA